MNVIFACFKIFRDVTQRTKRYANDGKEKFGRFIRFRFALRSSVRDVVFYAKASFN